GLSSIFAATINPEQVKKITAMLPAHPVGFGEPITNRAAWASLAALPAFQKLLREAQALSSQPLPDSPDDLYLDYSKTGNREHWQKVAGQRRGRIATFAMAECLDNRGRFLA